MQPKLNDFFLTHPVFTTEELTCFLDARGSCNPWTRKSLLAHHQKQGRILRVRRGLYCAVPPGVDPHSCPVDPLLIASKMSDDAVLAYHTALEFHGRAYSLFHQYQYQTGRSTRSASFRGYEFRPVLYPKSLRDDGQESFAVNTAERMGLEVRVTSLERTLVDLLDRPDLGGSWEEVWRSLESVEFFDLDNVVQYALLLKNSTTVAKVGFFLDQHRESLMVTDAHLQPLREHLPRKPHYLMRGRKKSGRLDNRWNLVVPQELLDRSWQEIS